METVTPVVVTHRHSWGLSGARLSCSCGAPEHLSSCFYFNTDFLAGLFPEAQINIFIHRNTAEITFLWPEIQRLNKNVHVFKHLLSVRLNTWAFPFSDHVKLPLCYISEANIDILYTFCKIKLLSENMPFDLAPGSFNIWSYDGHIFSYWNWKNFQFPISRQV